MRYKGELKNLLVYCHKCKKNVIVKAKDSSIYWGSKKDECDVCGSHKEVYLSFNCPKCSSRVEVEIEAG